MTRLQGGAVLAPPFFSVLILACRRKKKNKKTEVPLFSSHQTSFLSTRGTRRSSDTVKAALLSGKVLVSQIFGYGG